VQLLQQWFSLLLLLRLLPRLALVAVAPAAPVVRQRLSEFIGAH